MEYFLVGDVQVDVGKRAGQDAAGGDKAVREHLHRNGEAVHGGKAQQHVGEIGDGGAAPRGGDDAAHGFGAADDLIVQQEVIGHVGGGHNLRLIADAFQPRRLFFLAHALRIARPFGVDRVQILPVALVLRQLRVDRRQLLRAVEGHVLKGEEHIGVFYGLGNLCLREYALLTEAAHGFLAVGIVKIPAFLVLVLDVVGLQALVAQRRVLRQDEVAVRAEDQRDAVFAVQGEDEAVDFLLLFGVVILHFQHEGSAEVLKEPQDQLFSFGQAVLVDAGDAGGGDEHVPGVEGQQQLHVHARAVIVAAEVGLGEGEVQVVHALFRSGRQDDMAVGIVLLAAVFDEVRLGHIAPLETVFFRDQRALAVIALRAVGAGGQDGVPQFPGAPRVVLLRGYGVCKHEIGEIVVLVVVLVDHGRLPLFMMVSPMGQWSRTEQIQRQK